MDLLSQRHLRLGLSVLLLAACVPDLDTDESLVVAPRVLAITAEPAESSPGQPVRYRALVADSSGTIADAAPLWFHCLAQKPLAELGPISQACLRGDSGQLTPLGEGPMVSSSLPTNACALFGPNPPPPVAGQPPGRPVDPDESGGYKLPVMVGLGAERVTLFEQRISCGLAGVSPPVSVEYATRYHPNQSPSASALSIVEAGVPRALEAPLEVSPGAAITLEVAWPACPDSDVCGDGVCGPDETRAGCADDCMANRGCGGQERYLDYDREAQALGVRRESMRVAWYTTRGTFDEERTGVDAEHVVTQSKNTWRAPSEVGPTTLWVVLRDGRGGVGYREQAVIVR